MMSPLIRLSPGNKPPLLFICSNKRKSKLSEGKNISLERLKSQHHSFAAMKTTHHSLLKYVLTGELYADLINKFMLIQVNIIS